MKILLVSDAWYPQVNGVVRTLSQTQHQLQHLGHDVMILGPDRWPNLPCPTYPEIRLALVSSEEIHHLCSKFEPDAIHIATEGPLGWAARRYCLKAGLPFTTSFHTKFPEYLKSRFALPRRWTYHYLRKFHAPSQAVMVNTPSLQKELVSLGFQNLKLWGRGVDLEKFRPTGERIYPKSETVLMYVGRVAVEKNLEDFLSLDFPGKKVVVGDGPQRFELQRKFRDVEFAGAQQGESLTRYYNSADVFVFPSKTDTFGLVLLEALACGTPVAAYPVTGPLDVITDSRAGVLDWNLAKAVEQALTRSKHFCREYASRFSWENCTRQFYSSLYPIR